MILVGFIIHHTLSLVWESLLPYYYINKGSSTLIYQINENTKAIILTKGYSDQLSYLHAQEGLIGIIN